MAADSRPPKRPRTEPATYEQMEEVLQELDKVIEDCNGERKGLLRLHAEARTAIGHANFNCNRALDDLRAEKRKYAAAFNSDITEDGEEKKLTLKQKYDKTKQACRGLQVDVKRLEEKLKEADEREERDRHMVDQWWVLDKMEKDYKKKYDKRLERMMKENSVEVWRERVRKAEQALNEEKEWKGGRWGEPYEQKEKEVETLQETVGERDSKIEELEELVKELRAKNVGGGDRVAGEELQNRVEQLEKLVAEQKDEISRTTETYAVNSSEFERNNFEIGHKDTWITTELANIRKKLERDFPSCWANKGLREFFEKVSDDWKEEQRKIGEQERVKLGQMQNDHTGRTNEWGSKLFASIWKMLEEHCPAAWADKSTQAILQHAEKEWHSKEDDPTSMREMMINYYNKNIQRQLTPVLAHMEALQRYIEENRGRTAEELPPPPTQPGFVFKPHDPFHDVLKDSYQNKDAEYLKAQEEARKKAEEAKKKAEEAEAAEKKRRSDESELKKTQDRLKKDRLDFYKRETELEKQIEQLKQERD